MLKLEVLGTGCPKCQATLRNAEQAVAELGVDAEIVKVEDLREIMARGVMMTPALAIDGEIVVSGHIAPVAEIKKHLEEKGRG
ncbi:MAG TPA: thioredoxin family protein [Candidatus Bipolaricaulis anaerobius]|jgi:small redox-active disulfide protein 2|uniref:Thioredoxin n=1 Tax=Candidatus Bipolaricaulis anaerobius TaxID=2026885 RepID=A0A2X3L1N8_9BACT|nr:thioredoxin family protein [Candidatus Bipolaricaulis anaerobius]MDD2912949.1 thioredoxin family protein [Candidatus Bipolaricaulis anaerobius]SQD93079.1 Thioredoxin [Candidatus Bipolaricaulis anaerobius]HNR24333.1 thioredoxin family protein [Candidatus Bipolaricaulis anaerobius]HNS23584.1 thioredoxin family protein [Candidatus Bipolaricaulis anaerobius]HQM38173.1 thioredoxin family protein [Candidatus Bipolaricaulis anaerobius]